MPKAPTRTDKNCLHVWLDKQLVLDTRALVAIRRAKGEDITIESLFDSLLRQWVQKGEKSK